MLRRLGSVLLATALGTATAASQVAAPAGDTARFTVLLRGVRVGSEAVTVSRASDGWRISSTGQQDPPIDLVTTKFDMRYTADWQPQTLTVEALVRGQIFTLSTLFSPTAATNDILQGGQRTATTHPVSPRTVVLPNNFYGGYEALAARLASAAVGARLPVYVAPQAEIVMTVDRITSQRIVTLSGPVELRRFELTFRNPGGPVGLDISIDGRGRLARMEIPAASLTLVRDDISSVMAREERIRHPGDEDAMIPALGFSLGATITKPAGATGRQPAVILVPGSGPQDRDETVFNIPIFGQLAGAIADAGFFVVRYDKRGVGQSGGRTENVTLSDYADDVRSVIEWLKKRKDIDADRIAVVGHSEGGAVAMLVGGLTNDVAALALVAAPGVTGREVTVWQQQHVLATLNESDADKQAKVALQQRLMDAVVKGTGWEGVPPALRGQADTPWFKSWLLFDPAAAMAKVDQPILIVQGALDMQIPAAQADRLETLSRARKKAPATHTRKVVVPGVNHLLVPARTGEVGEYAALPSKTVSPEVIAALTGWLKDVLPPKR